MLFTADLRLYRREEAVTILHSHASLADVLSIFFINVVLEINVDLNRSGLDQEM